MKLGSIESFKNKPIFLDASDEMAWDITHSFHVSNTDVQTTRDRWIKDLEETIDIKAFWKWADEQDADMMIWWVMDQLEYYLEYNTSTHFFMDHNDLAINYLNTRYKNVKYQIPCGSLAKKYTTDDWTYPIEVVDKHKTVIAVWIFNYKKPPTTGQEINPPIIITSLQTGKTRRLKG
jgi:hypothetical protein